MGGRMTRQERDPERGTPTANEGTETSVEWSGGGEKRVKIVSPGFEVSGQTRDERKGYQLVDIVALLR
jgi:hypothetical protein